MRRCLAIFLLLLLPLQFSWAAVAVYCGHEADASQQHLGHHDSHHDHQGSGTLDVEPEPQADTATPGSQADTGVDCGHCHGNCASLLSSAKPVPQASPAAHPAAPACGTPRSRSLSPPERPQWARFA